MQGNEEPIDEWNCQLIEEINIVNENFSNNKKHSIAQRRTEKCGFNASSISTPAMLPPPERETFLTIPPGLTPAALLGCPVMLPNSQAPQAPTTGSFQQFSIMVNQEHSMSTHPHSFPSSSNIQSQSTYHFEFPAESPVVTAFKKCNSDTPSGPNSQQNMSCIDLKNTTKLGNCSLRGVVNPNINSSNRSDDGYTWRKYGQKTVKGSEFPRSYYKCTQQGCLVKKKVERSPDGQITEIIYKGEHNHHKSQPPRRATRSSNSYDLSKKNEGNTDSSIWRHMQFEGNKDVRAPSNLEKISSPSLLTEVSNPLMSNHQNANINVFVSAETTPEPSSTLVSCCDDEDEDRATEWSTCDDDDNEFDHKRRRTEMSLSSRTTREPRVVVQIESEIDILDDGYRWRKYGQKVVKGNPNPRSYYKCTSAGCPVRKHVERAPDNLKSVMTTYEGKHNHEVPSTNKTNGTDATATVGPPSTSNGKFSILTFPKNHKVSNLGIQVQDFNSQFESKPFEYLRSSFLESQLSDLTCGVASPLYNRRFPPNLQNHLSYNSLLFSPTQISSSYPFILQKPDFSLPLNFPMVPSLGGLHCNDLLLTPNGVSSQSSVTIGDQNHISKNNNNNNDKNLKLLNANEEIKMEHHLMYSSETL